MSNNDNELYRVQYFALDHKANEMFCENYFFSSKAKALDWLRSKTNEDMRRDIARTKNERDALYKCDLYTHIAKMEDYEGRYAFVESRIFSSYTQEDGFQTFDGTTPLLTSL